MAKAGYVIEVRGIVQGVGFRPFIHKQIVGHGLNGWVRNTSLGAELKIEGEREALDAFAEELWTKKPALALIEDVKVREYEPLEGFTDFRILASDGAAERVALVSPDICICEDCRRELFDPSNKRYRFPYINCTNCGPRFTIIKDIPYDRKNTTMADFPMCGPCEKEYTDIEDRRYHAQPTCCPDCGPKLMYCRADGTPLDGDPIAMTKSALWQGKIVAIKGLGGYHLAARADDPELAMELRRRKLRDEKPFAIMCRDIEEVRRHCFVSEEEEQLLLSKERPIVLLKKLYPRYMMHISENSRIGVMLPYTPVHLLLFEPEADGSDGCPRSLIMTSANISDRPIIIKDDEAFRDLSGIADGFLAGERAIERSCDDSVMWGYSGGYFARRSRGYVPRPLFIPETAQQVLALGAEQKASFCLAKGTRAFPSQHIGDLKNIESYENYVSQIESFERLFEIKPQALACDLHPDYLSSRYADQRAEEQNMELVKVQHHHAHMASCMADNGLDEPVIGIVWDGTGLGAAKNSWRAGEELQPGSEIWGGEFLTGDFGGFERQASIRPIRLPGGDKAMDEIWRTAASMLLDAGLSGSYMELQAKTGLEAISAEQLKLAERMLEANVNCPKSSGMGRLFDGAAALLGIRSEAGYEGQGAVLLEVEAESWLFEENPELNAGCYTIKYYEENGLRVFDWRPMIKEMLEELADNLSRGEGPGSCAAHFMNTLLMMAVQTVRWISDRTGIKKVVLSGGTFQNIYMMQRLPGALKNLGFEVFTHHRVSTNDEGLSLGQLMIAERIANVSGSTSEN